MPAWPLQVGKTGRIEDIPSPDECLPTEARLQAVLDSKELPEKVRE